MGHYGTEGLTLHSGTHGEQVPVFEAFQAHCSGKRINTEFQTLEAVRSLHPDKHVTVVQPHAADLHGFAKAGHAKLRLTTSGNSFQAQRTYEAPQTRLQGGDGRLGDSVQFGLFEYAWKGHTFQFYDIAWPDPYRGQLRLYYILSAREGEGSRYSEAADSVLKACGQWSKELHEEIYVFDAGCWKKSSDLWKAVQSSYWDDVILDPAMKQTLVDDVHSFFDSRAIYQEYAVPWKRGVIFHGTPGCGKTISIKALMNSLLKENVAPLYVKSFDACNGPQYSIRNIFSQARSMAPCLLIFEDLDSLVKDEVRSYFLNEVDGLESNDGILMIGSTNHLERLDSGISKRPSRFDRKYHYKLPGERERILYCEYWRNKLKRNSNVDFTDEVGEIVAKLTAGFSFAYMKELFVQTLLAIVGGRADAEDDTFDSALSEAAESTKAVEISAKLLKDDEAVEGTADGKAEADREAERKPTREPRKVPDVKIPDHLQDHSLLRILRKQIIALIADMDNTTDDDAAAKSKIY
ncbi:hypothetical protein BAUCODRAFT_449535 [Baudoinia panamericana UAMH 10762]|uniref:AAA+ ATPase domain-containing protein n=1 Tax=Baudoinia panamericana (strain UAMH 10762) TaxID=717646 RepID=M2N0B4_BAUPA|nr:uncharacterized protein BAUCODRAFT_449535 [Baudoinia panamericana UAMH 10762]EMC97368.1 hypothetical protein BAUCODRAFT_449535 [Baudoinia panamericana UAMH 10762]